MLCEVLVAKKKKGEFDGFPDSLTKGLCTGDDPYIDARKIPTGIPSVDHAFGGGWGCSRLAELFGEFGATKSALSYMTLAQVQKMDGLAILIDSEGGYTKEFFANLGGVPSQLFIPTDVDDVQAVFTFVANKCKELAQFGKETPPVIIVWDSIAETRSRHTAEVGMDKMDMQKARAISQGVDYVIPLVKKCNLCMIGINQTIENINSMSSAALTPGGRKWKYGASHRVNMQYDGGPKTSAIFDKTNSTEIGRRIRGTVVKSKFGPGGAQFILPLYTVAGYSHPVYDRETFVGYDVEESLFDYYVNGRFFVGDDKTNESRVVIQDGGWYSLHESIDSSKKKFRAKEWPNKLQEYPELWRLLYDDLEMSPEDIAKVVPVAVA